MSRDIIWTSKFKKDYKNIIKRKLDINLLDEVIRILARGDILPKQYNDHLLSGNWKGFRECHIAPDWLLIYSIEENNLVLVLSRTGTHSDLF